MAVTPVGAPGTVAGITLAIVIEYGYAAVSIAVPAVNAPVAWLIAYVDSVAEL